jgi:hypothetical protein
MQIIDIIKPLKKLQAIAEKTSDNAFREGYLMALGHAIELAEIQQLRINLSQAND